MGEKLLDRMHRLVLAKHYSHRTAQAHVQWAQLFILFHDRQHPREMDKAEVETFLTFLAVDRHVAVATRNQSLNGFFSVPGGSGNRAALA